MGSTLRREVRKPSRRARCVTQLYTIRRAGLLEAIPLLLGHCSFRLVRSNLSGLALGNG